MVDDVDFLAHIERAAADLPIVVMHQRKLCIRTSKKTGTNGYQDTYEPFGDTFLVDVPTTRSGWVAYTPGVGREVHAAYVSTGKKVAKPNDKAQAIALVPIASLDHLGELEISDTAMSAAYGTLYKACKAANKGDDLIPAVKFIGGINPRFEILDWAERAEDVWGAL